MINYKKVFLKWVVKKLYSAGMGTCIWDCSPVDTNLDVLDMATIPSKLRSEKLKKMCEKLKITDSYRVLYLNKLDYTYIPAALHHTNCSRLDFFCVSTAIIKNIQNCTIDNALASTVFDHKGICWT